jgi:hypothetical protein
MWDINFTHKPCDVNQSKEFGEKIVYLKAVKYLSTVYTDMQAN